MLDLLVLENENKLSLETKRGHFERDDLEIGITRYYIISIYFYILYFILYSRHV